MAAGGKVGVQLQFVEFGVCCCRSGVVDGWMIVIFEMTG